jgi:hypothetical protein
LDPERRRGLSLHLGPSVDLVGDKPGIGASSRFHYRRHLVFGEDRAGWVVRIGDQDHAGLFGDRALHLLDVEGPPSPAILLGGDQMEGIASRPEVAAESPALHVVRDHERQPAVPLEQRPQGHVVDLGAAVHDGHAPRVGSGIERGDPLP